MRHTGGGEGLRRGQRHTRLAVTIANEPSRNHEADTVIITNNNDIPQYKQTKKYH